MRFDFLSLAQCEDQISRENLVDAVVGIDLGTTFCAVNIYTPSSKIRQMIKVDDKNETYNSVILMKGLNKNFDVKTPLDILLDRQPSEFEYISGREAQDIADEDTGSVGDNFFYTWKGVLGVPNYKEDSRMSKFDTSVKYKVKQTEKRDKNNNLLYKGVVFPWEYGSKVYDLTPTKLTEMLLRDIIDKLIATHKIYPISSVITTPAHYDGLQEGEVLAAAASAGLKNVNIFKEPSAACLYYSGLQKENVEALKIDEVDKNILVVDIGGGTTDVAICKVDVERDEEEPKTLQRYLGVRKYAGDNFCGGLNINSHLYDHFIKNLKNEYNELKKANKIDESFSSLSKRFFVEHIENFKIQLCNLQTANPDKEKKDIVLTKTFALATEHNFETTLSAYDFEKICTPVWNTISNLLIDKTVGIFGSGDFTMSNITDVVLVGGSSRIPKVKVMIESYFRNRVPIFTDSDVDLAVSIGACERAISISSFANDDLVVVDVAPLSFGIETRGEWFEPIITRSTPIPTKLSKIFTTTTDGQRSIEIKIYSGIRPQTKYNQFIDKFTFYIDAPKAKGIPQIEITMELDTNYRMSITAMDKESGKELKHGVERQYVTPNSEDLRKLVHQAVDNEKQDEELLNRKKEVDSALAKIQVLEGFIEQVPSNAQKDLYKANLTGITKFFDDGQAYSSNSDIVEAKLKELETLYDEVKNEIGGDLKGPKEESPKEEEQKRRDL